MLKLLIFIFYTLAMLCTSLIPMDGSSVGPSLLTDMSPKLQNLLHIPMFALFVLLLFSLGGKEKCSSGAHWPWLVLVALAYGIGLELLQLYVPGRYASLLDVMLNTIGVGLGVVFVFMRSRQRESGPSHS